MKHVRKWHEINFFPAVVWIIMESSLFYYCLLLFFFKIEIEIIFIMYVGAFKFRLLKMIA